MNPAGLARIPSGFDIRLRENGGDVTKTEREIVGVSHDDIGGRMAERWALDVKLCALVAGHHSSPRGIESGMLRELERPLAELQAVFESVPGA
jgi:HD-like signal output (HDOD) protein